MKVLNFVEGPYGLHYIKTAKSKVFCPMEMGYELHNKISPHMKTLENAAEMANKPIKFYPIDNKTALMNFGTYTSLLKNDESLSEKLYKHIGDVLNEIPKKFLKK